jgi:23S rRNA pseudouridine955/2504/2580 synthase
MQQQKDNITFAKVSFITVPKDREGQRIDNFLLNHFKKIPKSCIYRILRSGEVRVNKKRCKPHYKILANDIIRLPPLWQAGSKELKPTATATKLLANRIIYEDESLLILNKPSGMASHGGSGINFGVIETLRAERPDETLELVHRLDKETSGCLIIAKKHSILRQLNELLREGKIHKKYLLLVRGRWNGKSKIVDAPLLKNQLAGGERKVKVNEKGKEAITKFVPQKIFANASLLEATLYSGKTHQIRVHSAYLGFPIALDNKYGDFLFNKQMQKLGLKRLFLHAFELKFKLPNKDKAIFVKAELDSELSSFLNILNP